MKRIMLYSGLIICILFNSSYATIVQIEASGTLTRVDAPRPGIIELGFPYTVRYVFDTTAVDQLPDDPTLGRYPGTSELILPNTSASYTAMAEVSPFDMRFSGTWQGLEFGLGLVPQINLPNDHFPWPFPSVRLAFFGGFDSDGKIEGPVTSLAITPEPATLLGGVVVLAFFLCRKQRL